MQQRLINIYENLYKTKYDDNDKNIKINVYNTVLFVNNNHIITLYSLLSYRLLYKSISYDRKKCVIDFILYYNNKNYKIIKQFNEYKQIVKNIIYITEYININIKKHFEYNNNILKFKLIYLNNYIIILYCAYYKYNYYYYISYINKKINKNIDINFIIKYYFLLYIIYTP